MLKRNIVSFITSVLVTIGMLALPVSAITNQEGLSTTTTTTSPPKTGSTFDQRNPYTPATPTPIPSTVVNPTQTQRNIYQESSKTDTDNQTQTAKTGGLSEISALLKSNPKHTDSDRKNSCVAAQNGIQNKFKNTQTKATTYQAHLDSGLTLITTYQTSHNLTVTDYAALLIAAQAAQATSAASVSALNSLNPVIDCNATDVATTVATFKTAVKLARTNLSTYRTSVIALFHAVQAVSATDVKATTGGTQ